MQNENKKKTAITRAHNDPWASALNREYGPRTLFYKNYQQYNSSLELVDVFNYMGMKLYQQTPDLMTRVNGIMQILGNGWQEYREQEAILLGWVRWNDAGKVTPDEDKLLDRYDFDLSSDDTLDEFLAAQKKVTSVHLRRQKDGEPVDANRVFYKKMYAKFRQRMLHDERNDGLAYCIYGDLYSNNAAILRYLAGKAINSRNRNLHAFEMSDIIGGVASEDDKVISARAFDSEIQGVAK